MTVSRVNIANSALETLGAKALGQPAEPNLYAKALQAYDEVYSELESDGYVEWGSTSDVPDEYSYHVINLTAYRLTNIVHLDTDQFVRIQRNAARSESRIKHINAGVHVPANTKIDNF